MSKGKTNQRGGFTFIDLLVVIAVIGLLAGVALKAAGGMGERVRRAQCQSNLREIGKVMELYARDSSDLLPDCTTNNAKYVGPFWPLDLNTNLVTDLEQRGAARKDFYCPSNPSMNDERGHHWDFWRFEVGARTRVVGYSFLLNGTRQVPRDLWRVSALGDGQNSPASTEFIMDATASTGGDLRSPLDATANARIDYTRIQGHWTDRSSHLRGLLNGMRPAGGNIEFLDGHVDWRDFSKMQHRFTTSGSANGPVTWDF